MKKGFYAALTVLLAALITGCATMFEKEKTVGKDIPADRITQFYYTCENVNFDAFFLRYHFTVKDGRRLFSYEKRERPGEYGPATEKDVVAKGERELSPEEWEQILSFLTGGTVTRRQADASSGGSGPWTYLYWQGDRDVFQQFAFSSIQTRGTFETFCAGLAGISS